MIGTIIISFVIGAITFGGQQWGKGAEFKRQQAEKQYQERIEMMKDLCEKKNLCDAEEQYLLENPPQTSDKKEK